MYKKYFHLAFQLNETTIFEVAYYRLERNSNAHFATSAAHFNRPKTDFDHCGQAQKELLDGHPAAMQFYLKWDIVHLKDLSSTEHRLLIADIEKLKRDYNYIESEHEISFTELKELSKQKVKQSAPTPQ